MRVATLLRMTTLETIAPNQLAVITGGMKWQDFRRSTNIEDRRSPEAIAEDDAWMKSLPVIDARNAWQQANARQVLDQWARDANARLGR